MSDTPDASDWQSGTRAWPHAPPHNMEEAGVYFVTARCLNETLHFETETRRDYLLERLTTLSRQYGWTLEAWAVLGNHYHFVALSGDKPDLTKFLRHLHSDTARFVNRLDGSPGRAIWHNFRDTHLTHEVSYLARLNYVHQNPVHHRIVPVAAQYRWCSARAFEAAVSPAWAKTIRSFKYDAIAAADGE